MGEVPGLLDIDLDSNEIFGSIHFISQMIDLLLVRGVMMVGKAEEEFISLKKIQTEYGPKLLKSQTTEWGWITRYTT